MMNFKKGDRVRWTGKAPLGSRGKTFADDTPEKIGLLGTVEGLIGTRTARVAFDDGQTSDGTFFTNLELVEDHTALTVGDRVVINLRGQEGKRGVVDEIEPDAKYPYLVRLDGETGRRCYSLENLTKETNTVTTIANFKSRVKLALDSLFSSNSDESAKDQAVRRLGIASALASRAESEKKAAKTKLKELGVIRDDYAASTTETVFDSERYTIEAVTNAGSQRLDPAALSDALVAEGISAAKRTRILRAAMKDIKPSTSFRVEAK